MIKTDFLDYSGKDIAIGGKELSWWIENYQLPLHINYGPVVRENIKKFKNVFQTYYPNYRICYAAKACTHPEILRIVKEEDGGADVASYYEMKCALESGISPQMLDLNGNCKEDFLIEEAISKDILIVADNVEEVKMISHMAEKMNRKPRILLRISGYELGDVTDDSIFTAGLWTKFGVPLAGIPEFIKTLDNYPNIDFSGFHTHIGSQIAHIEPYLAVIGKMVEMGNILKESGMECKIINIGGGFPVSYVNERTWNYIFDRTREGYLKAKKGDMSHIFLWNNDVSNFVIDENKSEPDKWKGEKFYTPYDKEKMLENILKGEIIIKGKLMNTVKALQSIGEPLLIIEPGRSIVDDSGITLARVNTVREVAGHHNLVTIEMGVTSHCESLIEKVLRRWEVATDYHIKEDNPFEAFVGGNLCFSGDMISKFKIFFQRKPSRGDVVIIHDTGAYSSSFMQSNCNSFPRPERVIITDSGDIVSMKKRDRYEDIIFEL